MTRHRDIKKYAVSRTSSLFQKGEGSKGGKTGPRGESGLVMPLVGR